MSAEVEEYGKFVLQSPAGEPESDFGYQPAILAAAAIGFVAAGVSPGGLSAATGFLLGLVGSLFVAVCLTIFWRPLKLDDEELAAVFEASGMPSGQPK